MTPGLAWFEELGRIALWMIGSGVIVAATILSGRGCEAYRNDDTRLGCERTGAVWVCRRVTGLPDENGARDVSESCSCVDGGAP